MKYIKQIQFFIFLLIGINFSVNCNQPDLEQRKQAVKEFICKEIEKGSSLEDIANNLKNQSRQFSEYRARLEQAKIENQIFTTAASNRCFPSRKEDEPFGATKECVQMKKDLENARVTHDVLWLLYLDSPERQAGDQIDRLLEIEGYKHRGLQKEKLALKEKEEVLIQEQQDIMKKLGLSPESE